MIVTVLTSQDWENIQDWEKAGLVFHKNELLLTLEKSARSPALLLIRGLWTTQVPEHIFWKILHVQ